MNCHIKPLEFECTTNIRSRHGHYRVLSGPTSVTIFVLERWTCLDRDDKTDLSRLWQHSSKCCCETNNELLKNSQCPSHRGVETVGHELTLAVRRDERNGAVVLEAWQTDALMELHILQLHRLTLLPWKDAHKQKLHTQKYTKEDWEPLRLALGKSRSAPWCLKLFSSLPCSALPNASAIFSPLAECFCLRGSWITKQ